MRITFAASEGVPYSKTGGLADVVGALPQCLAKLGHDLTVFLPRYKYTSVPDAKLAIADVTIPFNDQLKFCQILDGGKHDGVQFYFVDHPDYTFRESLYNDRFGEYGDNAERFTMFCRAVLESSKRLGVPDLFHVHDWQAALIPVLLRTQYALDATLAPAASVLTIHNVGYQGWFPKRLMDKLLLPWSLFTMHQIETYDQINLLKGGVVFADYLTTVSRTYAREIQTPEYSFGLDDVLRRRADHLVGIVNGVDYSKWNPASDRNIAANYSLHDLSGKLDCKKDLLLECGLPAGDLSIPVVGIVSRFAAQKGFDLIALVAEAMMRERLLLVVLGSGETQWEEMFRELARRYPRRVYARIGYDEPFAHKIEAGSDLFLMPSRYEPCGLNQIYSLKYGTAPVVRATGGLEDTVQQWDPADETGTGFKFRDYTGPALLDALRHALLTFEHDRDGWSRLQSNGMKQDFSWSRSAEQYVEVYERAVREHRGG